MFCVVIDENASKQVKHPSAADHQELLNSEDFESSDSSEEYVLYMQNRRR
jgi:hypothetical protein